LDIISGAGFFTAEREVFVGCLPLEFAARSGTTISTEHARAILASLGVYTPSSIYGTLQLEQKIIGLNHLTPAQIAVFLAQAKVP
jgi:hypothetical protein